MNKKGDVPILLKVLGFILLAALILLPLSQAPIKIWNVISNTFASQDATPKEGGFSQFTQAVNKVGELKEERYFNLNLNYNDIVFKVDDTNSFELKREFLYKNPVTLKELRFKKIERPKECNENSNCICKSKLSESLNKDNEAQSISPVSCIPLNEYTKIEGNMIINYPNSLYLNSLKVEDQEDFLILASLDKFSSVRKKGLSLEKTYSVPLFIKKEGLILKITYNS